MSAHDALKVIDARLGEVAAAVEGASEAEAPHVVRILVDVLGAVRSALTAGADWSEVQESNLRAELDRARADLAAEQIATSAASLLYEASLRHVEGERDRARATAVRLEQDLALAATGIQRRVL